MKGTYLFSSLTIILIFLSNLMIYSQQNQRKYYFVNDISVYQDILGKGYDPSVDAPKEKAINNVTPVDDKTIVKSKFKYYFSSIEMSQTSDFHFDIEGTYENMVVNSHGRLDVDKNSRRNSKSVCILIEYNKIYPGIMLKNVTLNGKAETIIDSDVDESVKMEKFKKKFGTSYVSSLIKGVSVVVKINIENLNQEEQNSLNAALNMEVGFGVSSGSLDMNLRTLLNTRMQQSNFTLETDVSGVSESVQNELKSLIKSSNKSNLDDILAILDTAINKVNYENAAIVGYQVTPYSALWGEFDPDRHFEENFRENKINLLINNYLTACNNLIYLQSFSEQRDNIDFKEYIGDELLSVADTDYAKQKEYIFKVVPSYYKECKKNGWEENCIIPDVPRIQIPADSRLPKSNLECCYEINNNRNNWDSSTFIFSGAPIYEGYIILGDYGRVFKLSIDPFTIHSYLIRSDMVYHHTQDFLQKLANRNVLITDHQVPIEIIVYDLFKRSRKFNVGTLSWNVSGTKVMPIDFAQSDGVNRIIKCK